MAPRSKAVGGHVETKKSADRESNCSGVHSHGSENKWTGMYSLRADLKWLPIGIFAVVIMHLNSPVREQMENNMLHALAKGSAIFGWTPSFSRNSSAQIKEALNSPSSEQTSNTAPAGKPAKRRKVLFKNGASIRVDIYQDDEYDGKLIGTMAPVSDGPAHFALAGDRFFYTQHGTMEQLFDTSNKLIEHVIRPKTTVLSVDSSAHIPEGKCFDRHRFCRKQANTETCNKMPGYMILRCCASCDPYINSSALIDPKVRCRRGFLNISEAKVWKPGDVNNIFTRLTASARWAKSNPRTLSSPPKGPWIVHLEKFLKKSECTALINRAEQIGFQSSKIQDTKTRLGEGVGSVQAIRTSSTTHCHIPVCDMDPAVIEVKRRVSALTGVDEGNLEIQFTKYEPHEYFKTHLDVEEAQLETTAGIRLLTLFVYLNDVESGGETTFPLTGPKVAPKRGSAVLWPNVLDGDVTRIDNRTAHAGMPVNRGVKFAANIWIHQYDAAKSFLWGCQG